LRAGGADAFEENGCGFVASVWRNELALERLLEDGFAEAGRPPEVRLNRLGEIVNQREIAL
jgi:hypothetical protein